MALLLLFSHWVVSSSLQPQELQHARLPCPSLISLSLLKLMSIEFAMPSIHLILCHPLLLLPSIFPSIRVFSNELALCIRWPKYWSFTFSISHSNEILPMMPFYGDVCVLVSHVWLFATPWTIAHQAPLSVEFCRQEYWSGLPFPSPGDLPNPGIKPGSPALQVDSSPSEPPGDGHLYSFSARIEQKCEGRVNSLSLLKPTYLSSLALRHWNS